jgi:hypothetical protein
MASPRFKQNDMIRHANRYYIVNGLVDLDGADCYDVTAISAAGATISDPHLRPVEAIDQNFSLHHRPKENRPMTATPDKAANLRARIKRHDLRARIKRHEGLIDAWRAELDALEHDYQLHMLSPGTVIRWKNPEGLTRLALKHEANVWHVMRTGWVSSRTNEWMERTALRGDAATPDEVEVLGFVRMLSEKPRGGV